MSKKIKAAFLVWTPNPSAAVGEAMRGAASDPAVEFADSGGFIAAENAWSLRRAAERVWEATRNGRPPEAPLYLGLGGRVGGHRSTDMSRQEAERAVTLARSLDLRPGVYSIDEMRLAEAIAGNADALTSLASLLDAIQVNRGRRSGRLLESLEAFVDAHLSLARAAEALRVHPHTLSYRLRRIEEALGLSFRVGPQRQVIEAALLARRLASRTKRT